MYENVNITGSRVKNVKPRKPTGVYWICMFVFAVCGVAGCVMAASLGEPFAWAAGGIGFAAAAGIAIYLCKVLIPIRQNNSNPNPVIEFVNGALVIYSPGGRKRVYNDEIKQVCYIGGSSVSFVFQKKNGKKYKATAEFLDDIRVIDDIRKQCNLFDLASDKVYKDRSFTYGGRTVYPLGENAFMSPKWHLLFASCIALFWLGFCVMLAIVVEAAYMYWVGLALALLSYAPFLKPIIEAVRNNRKQYPAIGLRDDGVIMVFHSYKKVDCLEDRIREITYKNDVTVKLQITRGLNTETWTTTRTAEEYGKVIFRLITPSGASYEKAAKKVSSCEAVAERINRMLGK